MSETHQFLCAICLEEGDEEFGELHPCRHKFHKECIRRWHTGALDLKCPTCRIESASLSYNVAGRHDIDLRTGFKIKTVIDYHSSRTPSDTTNSAVTNSAVGAAPWDDVRQ